VGSTHPRRPAARFVAVLAVAALGLATAPFVGARSAGGESTTVLSLRPVLPPGVTPGGPVPAGKVLSGVVALRPSRPTALAAYAAAVTAPGSGLYHRYLPAGQFAAEFGPSPASITAVEGQLRHDGLHVSGVAGNGLLVAFRGSAARVSMAFGTSMSTYRLAGGRRVFANTTSPRLPTGVARLVQAVVGLDDLLVPAGGPARPAGGRRAAAPATITAGPTAAATTATVTAMTATAGPAACPAAAGAATSSGGLTDTQIAHAYGANPLYQAGDTGRGQTVAVYELEPYNAFALRTFDTCYFGKARAATMLTRVRTVAVDGGDQRGPGYGEAALDVEDISAVAPGATLEVYEAPPSETGYLDEWNAIVSDDTARIVTSSYNSGCESEVAAFYPGLEQVENSIFEQAAVQGQSVLDASGDAGSDCAFDGAPAASNVSANDPASQPYVTAVGGTTIEDATDPPSEQVWNDGADGGGGGGGVSAVWPEPAWQAAGRVPGMDNGAVLARAALVAGPDSCQNAQVRRCREIPDVSAQADEYTGGITVFDGGQWATAGGTSSSTPLWAAMLADIDSTPACATAGGVGYVNPALYAIASVPAEYRASFNDVTRSDNDVFGVGDGLYPATTGYDMATGLGSPRLTGAGGAHGLAYYLCTPPSARPTITGITPPVVSSAAGTGHAGPVTLTVTGRGFEAGGVPDVAGLTIGTDEVSRFTVTAATTLTLEVPPDAVQEGNGNSGHGGGTYDVTVSLIGGATSLPTSSARLVVTNDPTGTGASQPVVRAVEPSGGTDVGGTAIRIYGSGFTAEGGATGVTVGGVAAAFTAISDSQIVATVPPESSGAGGTACQGTEDPVTDVCQTEVQVTSAGGPSVESVLYPEVEQPATTTVGLVAAPTEWDYLPAPHVGSVVFDPASPAVASEEGDTLVTINGSGFGALGLEWVDVGPPGLESSLDPGIFAETPTALTLLLPGIGLTAKATWRDLSVQTLASPNVGALSSGTEPSNVVRIVYAPVPVLTAVSVSGGRPMGPTSGGTRMTVTGTGFEDGAYATFEDDEEGPSAGTDYDVVASPAGTELRLVTPPEQAGVDLVSVCNLSGCSGQQDGCGPGCSVLIAATTPAPPADTFTFYPPGAPRLEAISPRAGPAATMVTIRGIHLDEPQAVYFGRWKATEVANRVDPRTGTVDPDVVTASVPSGAVGWRVDVRIVTAESLMTQKQLKSPINLKVRFIFTASGT
jgi:hypothetical protein